MSNIRKGDEVIVLTGKDKGKRGVVKQRVDANHVVVEGVNVAKKATKPNPMTGATGGIVDKLMPLRGVDAERRKISAQSSDAEDAEGCRPGKCRRPCDWFLVPS